MNEGLEQGEGRLRYRPNERAALIEANTAVFTVTSGPGKLMGATLRLGLPTMRRVLRGQKTPLVGHVLLDGRISLSIADGGTCSKIVKRPLQRASPMDLFRGRK